MKSTGLYKVYLITVILLSSASLVIVENETLPISVTRRLVSGDLYTNFNESRHRNCPEDNVTFLVSERMCVKNQELISGR